MWRWARIVIAGQRFLGLYGQDEYGWIFHAVIRAAVPAMTTDRPLAPDIATMRALIDDGSLVDAARRAGANP